MAKIKKRRRWPYVLVALVALGAPVALRGIGAVATCRSLDHRGPVRAHAGPRVRSASNCRVRRQNKTPTPTRAPAPKTSGTT